ncbi:MAG: hypothetical protein ACTHJ3_00715 [Pararhizobium sp.]
MRNAITVSDLRKLAEKLPSKPFGRHHRVALHGPLPPVAAYDPGCIYEPGPVQTITFEARETLVYGAEATAWFYNDVLVKVAA